MKVTFWLGALLLVLIIAHEAAVAQEGDRAGVVVRFDDERVESRCVALDDAEVSGTALLQRSGLSLEVKSAGQGGLICAIDGTGCSIDDCFCRCQGVPCVYWSYWRLVDDDWSYSGVGASIRQVSNGDVDGWSWGPGSVTSAIKPPAMTFEEVCAAGEAVYGELGVVETVGRRSGSTAWLAYVALGLLLAIIGTGALMASTKRRRS
jgi:hypothetical protein